ncbi:hypothetical protein OPV22_023901 [Ensete ventricosum]|uniref:Uncharacterized protein n=1 Tax=Ensete ventricosum TaxID=4639 RepID=A0AAV8QXS5_ENSVE|nr:hypothetical protein OPV22_023901 [Ensete ventricosum]
MRTCEAEVCCRVAPTGLPATEKAAFKVVSVTIQSLFHQLHDAGAGNAGRRGGLQGSGTLSASSSGAATTRRTHTNMLCSRQASRE